MNLKKKLTVLVSSFALVFVMLIVGVWAVKTAEFKVGGNISFTATGINATISQGVLSGTGSWVTASDADEKMKEIVLNTDKTTAQIEQEFLSWQDLDLLFNEAGDDVTITFSITNNSTTENDYVVVNINVSGGTMTNATAKINQSSVNIAPNTTEEFVITFTVTDKKANASLTGFEIIFSLEQYIKEVYDASTYPLTFTYDSTALTAMVSGNTISQSMDLEIPDQVKKDGKTYDVTSLGINAFKSCTYLTGITIPASVIKINGTVSNGAFYGCTNLKTINFLGDINDWASISFGYTYSNPIYYTKSLMIKGELITNVVIDTATSVRNYSFYTCNNLKSVTVKDTATSIGNYAFTGCIGLNNVILGDSVKTISAAAFNGCSELTDVTIGNGVTSISNSVFQNCSKLKSATIGNSVATISSSAFNGCSSLTEIQIPDSVTSIGSLAFEGCSGLQKVIIGNGVSSLAGFSFKSNTNLTEVKIGNSVTSIEASAFQGCTELTSVTIGNSVESIESCAFKECESLTEIIIPNSVKSVGESAFYNCDKLLKVIVGDGVINIGKQVFYGCQKLESVTLGNKVETIGEYTFYVCSSLTEITIPTSVTSIGTQSFQNCNLLKKIVIDSETIASGLTNLFAQGYLINSATTIYIKTDIVTAGKVGSFVTNTTYFPIVETISSGDYAGYTKYSK